MAGEPLFFRADRIFVRYFSAWRAVKIGVLRLGITRARAKELALYGRTAWSIAPSLRWRWKSSGTRKGWRGGVGKGSRGLSARGLGWGFRDCSAREELTHLH